MKNKLCKNCQEIRTTYDKSKYCEFCGNELQEITTINDTTLKIEEEREEIY